MLRSEKEIPKKARRPLRDYGVKLLPCQALYLSRKHGIPIALMNEDFEVLLCPIGSIAFGMRPPVKWWRQGNAAHKGYARTPKAARAMEKDLFRFDYREYEGMVSAPLSEADFSPDLVIVYGNSDQVMNLIAASRYDDGMPLTSTISARAVCSDAVVQTVQTGRCHLCIPCKGDRMQAAAADDELVFTAVPEKLGKIAVGLAGVHKNRTAPESGPPEKRLSVLRKKYTKLGKILEKAEGKS